MPDRRLFDYLPEVFHETKELAVLVDEAEQPESDNLWGLLGLLWKEQFIETAEGEALSRWEKMMGLPVAPTIDERRDAILARLREPPAFTMNVFEPMLEELCGAGQYVFEMDYERYELTVVLVPGGPMEALKAFLTRRLPANISISYYVRHLKLEEYTHEQLGERTHKQIREEH